jgi:hypothetical protein
MKGGAARRRPFCLYAAKILPVTGMGICQHRRHLAKARQDRAFLQAVHPQDCASLFRIAGLPQRFFRPGAILSPCVQTYGIID